MSDKIKILSMGTYLVYIIFWESLTIGGCAYLVFVCGISPWWFVLAVLLSGACLKPERWQCLFNMDLANIKLKKKKEEE